MCFLWYLEMFLFFFGRVSKLWECYVMVIIIYVFNLKLMVMVFIGGFYNGMIYFLCYFEFMMCFSLMYVIFVFYLLIE